MQNRFDKKVFDFFLDSEILDTKGYRRIPKDVFDPNARDADGDGMVQDATRFQRPAKPGPSLRPALNVSTPNLTPRASTPKPKGPKPKPVSIRENRNDRMTDWGRGLKAFAKNPQASNPYANGYYELEGIEDLVIRSQKIRGNREFWQMVPSNRTGNYNRIEWELSKKGQAEFKKLVNAEKLKRNNERKKFEADVIRYFGKEHLEGYKKDGLRYIRTIEDNKIRSEFRKYVTKNKNLSSSDIVTSMARGVVVPDSELTPEQKRHREQLKQQLIEKIRKVYANRSGLQAEVIIDGLQWNPEETLRYFWEKLKAKDSASVPGGIIDITDKRDTVIGAIMDFLDYSPRKQASSSSQEKSLRRSLGRTARRILPGSARRGGGGGRRFTLNQRFDPNARDADNDGIVQEMTRWERPAGPRNVVQPLRSPSSGGGADDSEDLDALLENLQRNRERTRGRFRLTAPDDDFDPDKLPEPTKPLVPGKRNRPTRLIDPSKPVSVDNVRNPKILPIVPGKPMDAEIRGLSRAEWNAFVDEFEEYYQRTIEELKPKDKKVRDLFGLRDSLKKIRVKDSDDGIELDGRDWYYARIIKTLKQIHQEGTDFENGKKIVKALEAELKRQGTSSAEIDLNQYLRIINLPDKPFEKVQDTKRDAKKVSSELNNLEKKVERAFGKIKTKQDALSAFNRAHPNISKHFDFLWRQTGDLSPSEYGLVLGYLNMFLEIPELKNYEFSFKKENNPLAGGSASIQIPWDAKNSRPYAKPMMVIRYRTDQTLLSKAELNQLRNAPGYRANDTIAKQASISYIKNNPDGLNDDELLARAIQIHEAKIAQHEATHISHYVKAVADAFPKTGTDGKAMMDAVRANLASEGKEGVVSNYIVGLAVNLVDTKKKRVQVAEDLLKEFDKQFANLKILIQAQQGGRRLRPDEERDLENKIVMALVSDGQGGLNQSGQIWNQNLPFFAFGAPDTLTRANLLAGRDYAVKQQEVITALLNSDKYKDLNDSLQKLRSSSVEKLGLKYTDLMREFWKDVMEGTEKGSAQKYYDIFSEENLFQLSFLKLVAPYYNDNLDSAEVRTLRKVGKEISRYAGATASQFYGFQQGNSPVETVAELTGALTLGQLPTRGTPEYNVVKKFIIWLKGQAFWDEIEASSGN